MYPKANPITLTPLKVVKERPNKVTLDFDPIQFDSLEYLIYMISYVLHTFDIIQCHVLVQLVLPFNAEAVFSDDDLWVTVFLFDPGQKLP